MNIAVVGASGLIGTKVVEVLRAEGHDVVAASRSSGVDVLTGAGLADALADAHALVDVTNSSEFEADAVMAFFTTSATNLVNAALAAGVGHYVALSIVGVEGLPDSGYFRAKVAQEKIITDSGIPYSIVRATQFAEFTDAITESMTDGDEVRVPEALIQPIAADHVAAAVARAAVAAPLNGILNIGGPKEITFEQMARDALARKGDDTRTVVVDPIVHYFGAALGMRSLVTSDQPTAEGITEMTAPPDPGASGDPVLQRLAQEITSYDATLDKLPVSPAVSPGEIREHLARYDFAAPIPLDQLIGDVSQLLRRWSLHANHPRYFGLFNPTVRRAGVMADALAALYNPQLAAWPHAPIANEIERHVLGFFMRAFGLDPGSGFANFTSGGQEANQTAVTVALTRAFPHFAERGARAIDGQPVLYVSAEAHHSFLKIAHLSGIGRAAVQHVDVDDQLRMDVRELSARIEADRVRGLVPFMAVATAGTTAAGAIDPLAAVAAVAKRENLWLHVDAAWGGAAVLSPTLRSNLAGIELADSITCDAHKWLSVPVGAGMFFTKHREPVLEAFRVEASSYVPPAVAGTFDPYVTTIQWSRRFIGFKLFLTLAELGWDGMAQLVEHQASMSRLLRERLESKGWTVVHDSPMAVLCFTHPEIESGRTSVSKVVDQVVGSGKAWISQVRLNGPTPIALRACITSHRTQPADIDILVGELERVIEAEPR